MQPDPELIERLRRSGIRIDREGQFIHEGEPVRHEGLRQALFRWLDRLDDDPDKGEAVRYILRLDPRRAKAGPPPEPIVPMKVVRCRG